MVEQRRADEKAVFIPLKGKAASVDDQFGPFLDTGLYPLFDAGLVLGCHHRAVMRIRIGRDADAQRLNGGDELCLEPFGRILPDRHHHRQRHAAFARRSEGRTAQVGDGLVQIGVGHDDAVIFRAAHGLHALSSRDAAIIDIMSDVRRADEADRRNRRMVQNGVDHFLVALNHLENAVGQPRLRQQLCQADGGGWVTL